MAAKRKSSAAVMHKVKFIEREIFVIASHTRNVKM